MAVDIIMQCCSLQGIASTPFLAGLDRTLPQLTPWHLPRGAGHVPGGCATCRHDGSSQGCSTLRGNPARG